MMNRQTVMRMSTEQIQRAIDNIAREIESLLADQRVLIQERERRMEAKWPQRATKSP
jgi:hypothetical protein